MIIERPQLPSLKTDSHKGNNGYVVIAGGNRGMLGAIILAGQAALRAGSGKVHLLSTVEHCDVAVLQQAELMSLFYSSGSHSLPDQTLAASVVALGPGLGKNTWAHELFTAILTTDKPLVMDADALNLLAKLPKNNSLRFRKNWILTPHPGEAARLLHCDTKTIQADRTSAAICISQQYGGVCVLKGAGTLVADDSGLVNLCNHGNPGMASAGMGDVLTGIIASFIGQGLSLRAAAEAAVWLHATSADKLVETMAQRSLLASDVVQQLSVSLKGI